MYWVFFFFFSYYTPHSVSELSFPCQTFHEIIAVNKLLMNIQSISVWTCKNLVLDGKHSPFFTVLRVHAVPNHSSLQLLSPLTISPLLRILKFSFLFGWDSLFPKAITPFFFLPQKLPASSCAFPYETKGSLISPLITRNVQPKKLFQSLLPPRKDLQWKSLTLLSAHWYLEMFGNLCPYFNETVYFPVL